jgi:hypothetical protein
LDRGVDRAVDRRRSGDELSESRRAIGVVICQSPKVIKGIMDAAAEAQAFLRLVAQSFLDLGVL